ncbi:hypothetical protein GCM10009539_66100 [Cryptosporangium japonicum]|uniref:Secreted protein n=1 Tax=Cryptosporangium japonicum TaxID=80872 RepID=A0ABN0V173_9ACTN
MPLVQRRPGIAGTVLRELLVQLLQPVAGPLPGAPQRAHDLGERRPGEDTGAVQTRLRTRPDAFQVAEARTGGRTGGGPALGHDCDSTWMIGPSK